jgi:hypothetical protein
MSSSQAVDSSIPYGCEPYKIDAPIKWVRTAFLVQTISLLILLSISFYIFTYAPLWAQWAYAIGTIGLASATTHTLLKLQSRFRFLWD